MTVVLDGIDEVLAAAAAHRHFGYSDWFVVDQARVELFASATGDQPLGGVIAQEGLTLSLTNYFLPQIVSVEGVSAGINYGADHVRFHAPVGIGKRVRAGVEMLAAEPITGGVQTTIRITVEVEDGDEPVCVVDSISRFLT